MTSDSIKKSCQAFKVDAVFNKVTIAAVVVHLWYTWQASNPL